MKGIPMRKGKRFTPARLERWRHLGRGTGTGSSYEPWHQVTRDDPGSRGRSHLVPWRFGRLHHLLSDLELVAFGFASMLPGLQDIREQFPLATEEHQAEIRDYRAGAARAAPGTLTIATDLGYRHPLTRATGESCPWVMSTDLVITRTVGRTELGLLAISVKHDDDLDRTRTKQLLRIEREYWVRQQQPWLLLTPSLHHPLVATAVRYGLPWALQASKLDGRRLLASATAIPALRGRSMRTAIRLICEALDIDPAEAQSVFWQSVWKGELPLDLSRPIRPEQPLEFLSQEAFWLQNPIVSGRSAWTH